MKTIFTHTVEFEGRKAIVLTNEAEAPVIQDDWDIEELLHIDIYEEDPDGKVYHVLIENQIFTRANVDEAIRIVLDWAHEAGYSEVTE